MSKDYDIYISFEILGSRTIQVNDMPDEDTAIERAQETLTMDILHEFGVEPNFYHIEDIRIVGTNDEEEDD